MKTVLVADDDRVLRHRVVHALEKAGRDLVLVEALTWQRPGYCVEDGVPDSVEKGIPVSLDDLLRTVADCSARL